MGKVLHKDLLREVRKSFSRFISIFTIVFIGVAFFSGLKATSPDMKNSMDLYYDEYNLMDIRIMSTLGLTDDDIMAISQVDGVLSVQPGYFTDVVVSIDSTERVFTVHSIPAGMSSGSNKDFINRYKLTEGRYPQKSGECLIEDSSMYVDSGLSVGDTIKVSSGKTEKVTDGTLAVDEFTIVGKAVTPYYLSYEKGESEIGSGKVSSFMAVLEDDFTIPAYTEALVTVKNAKQLNSYGRDYMKLTDGVVANLENLGYDRSDIRLEEVKKQLMDELDEKTKEYNEQKQLFNDEMKKAEEKLNDALIKLVEGETTLRVEKKDFQEKTKEAQEQISDAEKQLEEGEAQYAAALAEYNKAMAEYGDDLGTLDRVSAGISNLRDEANKQINLLKKMLMNPNLSDSEKQSIDTLINLYEKFLSSAVDPAVNTVTGLNGFVQGQVKAAGQQLADARKELDEKTAELAKAKYLLSTGAKEANAKFAASQRKINEGWDEYYKGKAEYEKEKAEGEKKLEDGYEQIIRAQNQIDNISKPQWYVLDRNSHYSYVDYGRTADQINAIASIFPVFFLLVASLVCLTTMTRMVDEQRGIIGVYKALGYSNGAIALKYTLYAAIPSLLGGVFGLVLGMNIFPSVIYNLWSLMYTLPAIHKVSQIPLMVASVLVGILVSTLSAFIACYRELKETPALLMRPKTPKAGKKIFLEKINSIWRRLSFSQKVTARNILRYKRRFLMTVTGIAGCCALLLCGFGLKDSISQVVNKQFKEIFTYDMNIKFTAEADQQSENLVMNALDNDKNVASYGKATRLNAKAGNDKDDIAVTLIIPEKNEELKNYITLRDRSTQKPVEIPEKGVIINEKLAKELNVKTGDIIELNNGDGARKKVTVAGITENYVFHYVYMSADYYREIYRLSPKVNSIMIKLKTKGADEESKLGGLLNKYEAVASVEYYSEVVSNFQDTVKTMNSIVLIIIASAGLLAFVVLYNLTNINIGERIREIATIKVLGFYNNEVSAYVYRENVILSLLGSIIGLPIGVILHRFIMVSIEQEGIMYGYNINSVSVLYALAITMIFVILVSIFMYGKLKKIPMVESLKSVE